MRIESIWSDLRFYREWQYLWADWWAHLQAELIGPDERGVVDLRKAGGSWRDWIESMPRRFIGKLADRKDYGKAPAVTIGPSGNYDDDEYRRWAFNNLEEDWNSLYRSEHWKGGLLGAIADEFMSAGVDLNDLKEWSLNDLDRNMADSYGTGLDDFNTYLDDRGWKDSQYYARLWAESEGFKWLAVYDENGNRAGRAYDVVTDMYRKVLTQSIERDLPLDQLRQALLTADDTAIKDMFIRNGKLDESAYQAFIERHLSRDIMRMVVTESAFACNNGQLLQTLKEGRNYVVFGLGGMGL